MSCAGSLKLPGAMAFLGGEALGTVRMASAASQIEGMQVVDALADRYARVAASV